MTATTPKADAFMRANDASPVIAGRAYGNGGEGGEYLLENGRRFSLPLKDHRALRKGYPKWRLG